MNNLRQIVMNFVITASEAHCIDVDDAKKEHFAGRAPLLDDEEIVLKLCADQLEIFCLEGLTARDGQAAIEGYQEKRDEIDLVILDRTMPMMVGELFSQIAFFHGLINKGRGKIP